MSEDWVGEAVARSKRYLSNKDRFDAADPINTELVILPKALVERVLAEFAEDKRLAATSFAGFVVSDALEDALAALTAAMEKNDG